MKLNLKRPIIFFDLETTGVDTARDRIVEISMIKIMPDGEEITRTRRLNPGMPIPAEATAVHGITDEDVKDAPTFAQVARSLEQFIRGCDFGGFNSNRFDLPVLVEEFLRAGVDVDLKRRRFIDVQNIFHKKEQRTLVAAYKFYCDKELDDAHSAEADTRATYEVLEGTVGPLSRPAERRRCAGRVFVPRRGGRLRRTHPLQREGGGGLRVRQVPGPVGGRGLPRGAELLRVDDERGFSALYQEGDHRNPDARQTQTGMKRLCATLLFAAWGFCALAAGEKSRTIVYINGAKYYIHAVQPGETLYGLAKLYGVGEKVIVENNPALAEGLKSAANIRIPVVAEVSPEKDRKSERKLRKTFDFHFVTKGETLYAISRQYEIPVKTIIGDNSGIDPHAPAAGRTHPDPQKADRLGGRGGEHRTMGGVPAFAQQCGGRGHGLPHRAPGRDVLFARAGSASPKRNSVRSTAG